MEGGIVRFALPVPLQRDNQADNSTVGHTSPRRASRRPNSDCTTAPWNCDNRSGLIGGESSVGISAIAQLLPLLDCVDMDGAALLARDVATGVRLDHGRCIWPDENGTGAQLLS